MIVRRRDACQQPHSVNDGAIVIARDTLSICYSHSRRRCRSTAITPRPPSNMVQPAARRLVAGVPLYSCADPAWRAQGRGQDPAGRPRAPRVIVVCPGDRPRRPGLARRPLGLV